MKIVHDHNMEKGEAIKIIYDNLEELIGQLPAKIKNFNHRLDFNVLSFSFDVSMVFCSPTVNGEIEVDDEQIKLELELPGPIAIATSEVKISEAIKEKLIELFPNN